VSLYLVLAVPAGIAAVPLALLGGHRAAARMQRRLARRYLHLRIDGPAAAGRAAGGVGETSGEPAGRSRTRCSACPSA
jgi:hypothetical protein